MGTTVLGTCTPALEAALAERRRLGQDRLDEVWQGEYHMVPGPHPRHARASTALLIALHPHAVAAGLTGGPESNVGAPDDYRVPDQVWVRGVADDLYLATAAIVVEVLSPGDESRQKFDFFATHDVEEVVIVDPESRQLEWYVLAQGAYQRVDRSAVLGVDVAVVLTAMTW